MCGLTKSIYQSMRIKICLFFRYDHEMVWLTAGQSEEEDSSVKRGRNVFLCHESYSPAEIAEKGSTVDFSWSIPPDMSAEVIYVNRLVIWNLTFH